MMKKLQAQMERFLVPLASKINSQRHVVAIRDAFTLVFPLTMAGSLVILINFVFLSPDGFVAQLLNLEKFIPNLAEYQAILSPVINGTTNIMSLLVVFLVAYELSSQLKGDSVLTGVTALAVYFILYPENQPFEGGGSGVPTSFLGAQGLFVAILVGLFVGELLTRLSNYEKLRISMPETVPPAVSKSFNLLIPIIIILAIAGGMNFIFSRMIDGGIQMLIYTTLQAPLTKLGGSIFTVLTFAIVQQFFWVLGIHGPNTLSAVREIMFAEMGLENLSYVASNGTAWGAPHPVTWVSINDAFGNTGGSGATLGLVIAILIAGKRNKAQHQISKISIAPGIFNINETMIFGLPIVMNPIYIIPFIFAPVILNIVGYLAVVVFKIMPPVAFSVAWTTPGFLIPFIGSGANSLIALLIGIFNLFLSTIIYLPFVIASNKVAEKEGMLDA